MSPPTGATRLGTLTQCPCVPTYVDTQGINQSFLHKQIDLKIEQYPHSDRPWIRTFSDDRRRKAVAEI